MKRKSKKADTTSSSKPHNPRSAKNRAPKNNGKKWQVPSQYRTGLTLLVFVVAVIVLYHRYADEPIPCTGICSIQDEETYYLNSINDFYNCVRRDPSRVLFYRIPKTATTTMTNIFSNLKNTKGTVIQPIPDYKYGIGDGNIEPSSLGSSHQRMQKRGYENDYAFRLREKIGQSRNRTVFEGHTFFVDLPPEYSTAAISFVRDPIERLASSYYYLRHGARTATERASFVRRFGNQSLEECALSPGCREKNELRYWCSIQTLYFCGMHKDCDLNVFGIPEDTAFERAKKNILDNFLFVGLVEDFNTSVAILEQLIPTYLEGAKSELSLLYQRQEQSGKQYSAEGMNQRQGLGRENGRDRSRREMTKKEAEEEEKERAAETALKALCQVDYQLYDFVREYYFSRQEVCGRL